MKGKFIVFEGTDACGKTTQLIKCSSYLTKNNIPHITTREPGGTKTGEKIREILMDNKTDIKDYTELLLLFAARYQHLKEVILPNLVSGVHVLCDRYVTSTLIYQYMVGRINEEHIDQLINMTVDTYPDLELIYDVDLLTARHRMLRSSMIDRFEKKYRPHFTSIRNSYLYYAVQHENAVLIDGNKTIEEVEKDTLAYINKLLKISPKNAFQQLIEAKG